jgi:hypothetical protein
MPRMTLALALLISAAWPLSYAAQAQTSQPLEGCAQHQARFPALLGKAPEEVRAALQAMPGITTVRMGGLNTPMTRDYRMDRATVLIENGVVKQITCG